MLIIVFIVDDHVGFCCVVWLLLEVEGYVVIGESVIGGEALEVVVCLCFNVVLLDIGLLDVDGIEVFIWFMVEDLLCKVVLIFMCDVIECVLLARTCGACGFIVKLEFSGEVIVKFVV